MPEFSPNEGKVAIATLPVKPAGLVCAAELWLGNLTKVATSGLIPFISTGASQSISLPITMPGVEGAYPVHLSIFSNGLHIAEFRAVEDVVITPVGVAEFVYVSDIRWTRPGGQHRFEIDVQNVGNVAGVCSLAMLWRERYESLGEDWRGWHTVGLPSATLQPGETRTFGYTMVISFVVDHFQAYFSGSPGTSGIIELGHVPRATNGWWQVV